jgi:hypothetical protein
MAKYRLTNPQGVQITVTGERPPSAEAVPQMFAAARQQAIQNLKEGDFVMDEDYEKVDKQERRRRIKALSARALNVPENQLDTTSGMDFKERTLVMALPDDKSKIEYLEKRYGNENVAQLDIKGDPKLFFRNPSTNKMTMVDELGTSFEDFTSDIFRPVAQAVGGTVGALVGSGVGPAGTVGGAAVGTGIAGGLVNVAAQVLAQQDVELGKIAKKNSVEAAIGIPIDIATMGIGRFVGARIAGKKAAKAIVGEVDKALDTLNKSKIVQETIGDIKAPPAIRTGVGSRQASEIAAARPTSKLASQLSDLRDKLFAYKELATGSKLVDANKDKFIAASESFTESYKRVLNEIAEVDPSIAKILKDELGETAARLSVPAASKTQTGKTIRELLQPGVTDISNINNANFNALRSIARGRTVPIERFIDAVEAAKKDFDVLDEPQSKALVQKLKKIMDGEPGEPTGLVDEFGNDILGPGTPGRTDISFQEFREYLDIINDIISSNKEAGFAANERVASRVMDKLRGLRDDITQGDPELGEAFETAMDFYQNTYLATKRGGVGAALKEKLAADALTDTQVVSRILNDPTNISEALRIAGQAGNEAGLRSALQKQYLNDIGLVTGDTVDLKSIRFDEDIVRVLFGDNQVRALQNLQKRLQQSKVKFGDIKENEIAELFSAFSTDAQKAVMDKILKRMALGRKKNELLNATLLKKLLPRRGENGEFLEPEMTGFDLARFAERFVDADPSAVRRSMQALKDQGSPEAVQAFEQAFIDKLFAKFASNAQTDRFGNLLWNPEAFSREVRPGTAIFQNMQTVLGKKGAAEMRGANRILQEGAETRGASVQQIFQPRYSLTRGGVQLYGVGNLIGGLRGRALAWAYKSGVGSRYMRFIANRGTETESLDAFRKIVLPMTAAPKGVSAAAISESVDADFGAKIQPLFTPEEEE